MRLRRSDGKIYLDRWGLEYKPIGGVFIHRMQAPDPGIDLHDHPWTFWSFVVKGGYLEVRQEARRIGNHAEFRARWSWRKMRLDECHRIIELWRSRPCWTLVIHGPVQRTWGFYVNGKWMQWQEYDRTVRAERRDLHYEVSH